MATLNSSCLFCKIIQGSIPCKKVFENAHVLAFLDIGPLSLGHTLVIPKYHGAKLHEVPDDYLSHLLPAAKRIATALGTSDYNILQNNGRMAHQAVDHVHVHVIPKANESEGLTMEWDTKKYESSAVDAKLQEMISNL